MADNIDLLRILSEFSEYHEVKFDIKPTIVREKSAETKKLNRQSSSMSNGQTMTAKRRRPRSSLYTYIPFFFSVYDRIFYTYIITYIDEKKDSSQKEEQNEEKDAFSFHDGISGQKLQIPQEGISSSSSSSSLPPYPPSSTFSSSSQIIEQISSSPYFAHYDQDTLGLLSSISREIVVHKPNVHWDDVIGLFIYI